MALVTVPNVSFAALAASSAQTGDGADYLFGRIGNSIGRVLSHICHFIEQPPALWLTLL